MYSPKEVQISVSQCDNFQFTHFFLPAGFEKDRHFLYSPIAIAKGTPMNNSLLFCRVMLHFEAGKDLSENTLQRRVYE